MASTTIRQFCSTQGGRRTAEGGDHGKPASYPPDGIGFAPSRRDIARKGVDGILKALKRDRAQVPER